MTTITINGQTYNLVALPPTPGIAEVEMGINDTVATVTSPFTRQTQTQSWPGADWWDATVTMPPMSVGCVAAWRGFLAELRGRANVFQISDPAAAPVVNAQVGAPVVNSSVDTYNLPMTTSLVTRGWMANGQRLLLRGQQFQIGYRLHMVCENVSADAGGNATLSIWPSIRETPEDGTPLVLKSPQGLFRLSSNRRAVQWSPERAVSLSFKCEEVR